MNVILLPVFKAPASAILLNLLSLLVTWHVETSDHARRLQRLCLRCKYRLHSFLMVVIDKKCFYIVNAERQQRAYFEVKDTIGRTVASATFEGQGVRVYLVDVFNNRPHWSFGPFNFNAHLFVTISNFHNGRWNVSKMVGPLEVSCRGTWYIFSQLSRCILPKTLSPTIPLLSILRRWVTDIVSESNFTSLISSTGDLGGWRGSIPWWLHRQMSPVQGVIVFSEKCTITSSEIEAWMCPWIEWNVFLMRFSSVQAIRVTQPTQWCRPNVFFFLSTDITLSSTTQRSALSLEYQDKFLPEFITTVSLDFNFGAP